MSLWVSSMDPSIFLGTIFCCSLCAEWWSNGKKRYYTLLLLARRFSIFISIIFLPARIDHLFEIGVLLPCWRVTPSIHQWWFVAEEIPFPSPKWVCQRRCSQRYIYFRFSDVVSTILIFTRIYTFWRSSWDELRTTNSGSLAWILGELTRIFQIWRENNRFYCFGASACRWANGLILKKGGWWWRVLPLLLLFLRRLEICLGVRLYERIPLIYYSSCRFHWWFQSPPSRCHRWSSWTWHLPVRE